MAEKKKENPHKIGQLNESSLHNQIKHLLASEGDILEKKIGRYYIDIVKPDRLVEIQTASFGAIRAKLQKLLKEHKVTLVYPIAWRKMIVYFDEKTGNEVSKRRSPKRGKLIDVFQELLRIPQLFTDPNLTLQVALIKIEEHRIRDGKGSWRRGGVSIVNRKLVELCDLVEFENPKDLLNLLPQIPDSTFTTKSLAQKCKIRRHIAQKICYTLRKMGAIEKVGCEKRFYVYRVL
ncbi:MAG: hypothetical protein ACLFSQ_06755 [Candidatus Zixiibacteriota bacterium]